MNINKNKHVKSLLKSKQKNVGAILIARNPQRQVKIVGACIARPQTRKGTQKNCRGRRPRRPAHRRKDPKNVGAILIARKPAKECKKT